MVCVHAQGAPTFTYHGRMDGMEQSSEGPSSGDECMPILSLSYRVHNKLVRNKAAMLFVVVVYASNVATLRLQKDIILWKVKWQ